MRRRQHVAPTIAALVIVALVAWSFYVALASAAAMTATESAAWSARLVAASVEPLPSGAAIPVVIGTPVLVDGVEAGGTWDGTTVRAYGPDDVVVEHELGHAFDDRDLDPVERAHLNALMGYGPSTPWANQRRWTEDLFCAWLACPNERFASLYAGCALGYHLLHHSGDVLARRGRGEPWWSRGYVISVASYGRVCGAIKRYAATSNPGA